MNTSSRHGFAIAALLLLPGLAGCGAAPPTGPTIIVERPVVEPPPPPPPPEVRILVFTDAISGLQTSDVRDVHGQIVQFNSAGTLIWGANNTEFPRFPTAYSYDKDAFEVQWGTEKGERRAYLTFSPGYWHYPPPASIVDLEMVEGKLVIRHPEPPVFLPGS